MDHYERMQSWQKKSKDKKELKKSDKLARGKSLMEFAEGVQTAEVDRDKYRNNWEKIFGKKTGNDISGESTKVPNVPATDRLD